MTEFKTIPCQRTGQGPLEGLLLGAAVGDALGLPAEGLSPARIHRLWHGVWKMRFLFGRGMTSDDTEHTLMVAQALLIQANNPAAFQRALAWKFRFWFASLPAGVGLATARACLKLWLGFPVKKCGVNSAGDGPAMRSAIIGAFFAADASRRREFVFASSRLTHTGWKAETAALAVAEAAALAVNCAGQPELAPLLRTLRELSAEPEWQAWLAQMEAALKQNDSVRDFARRLGLENGVSGYALHAVPVAVYAWMRHPGDFQAALIAVLECGGDADTVGAIVGALAGASCGPGGIPQAWLNGIVEWPRSVAFMRTVAQRLAEQGRAGQARGEVVYFWPGVILRNLFFLVLVLAHGLRRLLPPY